MEVKLKQYEEMFGKFPIEQIRELKTEEEIIDILDHCIGAERDAYSLGYLR